MKQDKNSLNNVEMIHVGTERDFYMTPEQHLNTRGKEKILMKIASTIESMLGKKWNLSV
jgi:hypothetical protein